MACETANPAMTGVLLAVMVVLGACAGQEKKRPIVFGTVPVTAEQMGASWPLKVDRGELRCEGLLAAVFRADGVSYALNVEAASEGYADISPLLKQDYDVDDLLQTALSLCL